MDEYIEKLSKAKCLLHMMMLLGIMFIGDFIGSLPFDIIFMVTKLPYHWIYGGLRIGACIGVTYLLFDLYTKKILRTNMNYFRSGKLSINFIDFLFALALPLGVVISFIVVGDLSYNSNLTSNIITIVCTAMFRAMKAGILEEVLFRGYIMKLVEIKWNKYVAIILPSFMFSLLHIPSMQNFSFVSLFLLICGGTLVGMMFSLVAYKDNTIWGSALIHTVWNFIIIGNILSFGQVANNKSIFSIVFPSENPLLTGGDFGVEASIIAIIGYAIISLIIFGLIKKDKHGDLRQKQYYEQNLFSNK